MPVAPLYLVISTYCTVALFIRQKRQNLKIYAPRGGLTNDDFDEQFLSACQLVLITLDAIDIFAYWICCILRQQAVTKCQLCTSELETFSKFEPPNWRHCGRRDLSRTRGSPSSIPLPGDNSYCFYKVEDRYCCQLPLAPQSILLRCSNQEVLAHERLRISIR